jgi:hypothetical protein
LEDPSHVQGLPAFMDDGAGFIGVITYGFQPASENPILETVQKVHSEISETLSTSNLLFFRMTTSRTGSRSLSHRIANYRFRWWFYAFRGLYAAPSRQRSPHHLTISSTRRNGGPPAIVAIQANGLRSRVLIIQSSLKMIINNMAHMLF